MMRLPMAAASAAMFVFLLAPQGYAADKPQANPQSSSETYRQLDLFGEVFERVRSDYVEGVSDQQLI
jgi:carboxyl-terminal processing protease